MRHAGQSLAGERGFTLAEVLVGISLLGLVLALAFAGMRFVSNASERTEVMVDSADAIRVVHGFLRDRISQARPVFLEENEDSRVAFVGDSKKILFVASSPVQPQLSGALWLFFLRFRDDYGGSRLEVGYRPYFPGMPLEKALEMEGTKALIRKVDTGEIAYFGIEKEGDRATWQERWERRDALPELVKVSIKTADATGVWPDLLIPIRIKASP